MLECSHRKESISKHGVVFKNPCRKRTCPECGEVLARKMAIAIWLAQPTHEFTYSFMGKSRPEIVQGMNAIFGCWAHLYPGFRWAYTIDPEPDEVLVRGFCYASEPIGVAGGWGVATCVEFRLVERFSWMKFCDPVPQDAGVGIGHRPGELPQVQRATVPPRDPGVLAERVQRHASRYPRQGGEGRGR